jgi:hypothetical protein
VSDNNRQSVCRTRVVPAFDVAGGDNMVTVDVADSDDVYGTAQLVMAGAVAVLGVVGIVIVVALNKRASKPGVDAEAFVGNFDLDQYALEWDHDGTTILTRSER